MVNMLLKKKITLVLLACLVFAAMTVEPAWAMPKNVMLFIGDGMGIEHIEAARLYKGDYLCFESFGSEYLPQGLTTTYPADVTEITDSAAAGTALATGRKVFNGVVSLEIPGDESELETLLEIYSQMTKVPAL